MSMERDDLHRILDEIPENEIRGVRRYLEYVRDVGLDPLQRALKNAPLDDEPETEEERRANEAAEEDFKAGRNVSSDELKRELGIQDNQWEGK